LLLIAIDCGVCGPPTVTVALACAVEQVTVYMVVTVGDSDVEPDVAPPVEKFVPAQELALVLDQVSVEDWPELIVVGFADREAVID
jgi:hypothetical protein